MAWDSIEQRLEAAIRDVPDFPKPGILFKDITTLLRDSAALRDAVHHLSRPYRDAPPDYVVGIEARGFPFAAGMALDLDCGLVLARKPGKLPGRTVASRYTLEYGDAVLEMHEDALGTEHDVLVVDDVLATGGTAAAAVELVRQLGARVRGAAFLMELGFLDGRSQLEGVDIHALLNCAGE